jgi:hypothetical protein
MFSLGKSASVPTATIGASTTKEINKAVADQGSGFSRDCGFAEESALSMLCSCPIEV